MSLEGHPTSVPNDLAHNPSPNLVISHPALESSDHTFARGGHARLEVDHDRGIVTKEYNLSPAISASHTVRDYLTFRAGVSQFYRLPELISTCLDGDLFSVQEKLITGTRGDILLAEGSEATAVQFVQAALLPLAGQIMPNTSYNLLSGRISKTPLKNPVDIKPVNFVISHSDNQAVFVDVFPPLIRTENGSLTPVFPNRDGRHTAWIYGDASIIITKFLMDCISVNPGRLVALTLAMIDMIATIDPTGLLLSELQINSTRPQTIAGYSKISHGPEALDLIGATVRQPNAH